MLAAALVTLVVTQVLPPYGYVATPAASLGPDGQFPLPRGVRLLDETLRVPFGDDGWGGEMRRSLELGGRVSFGGYTRAWSDGVCDPHWCGSRAIRLGVDAQIRVVPLLDVNIGYEAGVGNGAWRGPTIRARFKF